ncbi:hypothetical protein [Sulfurovum mangrovi]|uniref:hypothetical protein n=1 Tax=Sulfurovum mangrovi TaxID=2893889 RepID=UPI001E52AC8E|nr:hypothetical protein [Sulfurovum mangrovi]UFH58133.1 hypothetical protein LN246_07190 [Sulfurovum mangrovi]
MIFINLLKMFLPLILFSSFIHAQSFNGTFTVPATSQNNAKRNNSFEIEKITVRYSIGFLMGDVIIKANASYKLGKWIRIDGKIYDTDIFPPEVQKSLKLTELKIYANVENDYSNDINMGMAIDMGALGKPDEWSYNVTGSPEWDRFLYTGFDSAPIFLPKDTAVKIMKQFKRLGMWYGFEASHIIVVNYDVSAARRWLKKQNRKKESPAQTNNKTAYKSTKPEVKKNIKNQKEAMSPHDKLAALTKAFDERDRLTEEEYQISSNTNTNSVTPKVENKKNYKTNMTLSRKWKRTEESYPQGGILTMDDRTVNIQYYYANEPSGQLKTKIVSKPDNHHWILEKIGDKSKFHLIHTEKNYMILLPDGSDINSFKTIGGYTRLGSKSYWRYEFVPLR